MNANSVTIKVFGCGKIIAKAVFAASRVTADPDHLRQSRSLELGESSEESSSSSFPFQVEKPRLCLEGELVPQVPWLMVEWYPSSRAHSWLYLYLP